LLPITGAIKRANSELVLNLIAYRPVRRALKGGFVGKEYLLSLLRSLSESFGPSGFEDAVREIVIKEVESVADSVWVDSMGNLFALKRGRKGGASLMLTAHMDEIGFLVTHVDNRGFLRVAPIGGQSPRVIQGQRVLVRARDGSLVKGVIGSKPPHVMKPDEAKQCPEVRDVYVDVGATSAQEVERIGITVGSPVAFERGLERLNEDTVVGKAFDDRAGLAAVIGAFKAVEDQAVDVYLVATVQEEVGLRGAQVAAYKISPSAAIGVDTTIAADVPGNEERDWVTRLGAGPAIKVADNPASFYGLMANRPLRERLEEVARSHGIPYQLEVLQGGTTDASAIALTKEGIPAAVVSVPTRYVHSPSEVLRLSDLEGVTKLLALFTEEVSPDWLAGLSTSRVK
jgi:endoglucanase